MVEKMLPLVLSPATLADKYLSRALSFGSLFSKYTSKAVLSFPLEIDVKEVKVTIMEYMVISFSWRIIGVH